MPYYTSYRFQWRCITLKHDFSNFLPTKLLGQPLPYTRNFVRKTKTVCVFQFADNSFDLVIDKGGLDALMGEDVEEGSEAGQKFLSEVQRVLSEGGSYICISLLQSHVLSKSIFSHTCSFFAIAHNLLIWDSKLM